MELLKLSKFKLQLQAFTSELRDLRKRENSTKEQCHILIQKQKQTEEEFGRKFQELQSELGSSGELCQKLERKVDYLQNDNVFLENRQKELQGTIQNLLQSRESFVNAYEESTWEMKRAIEARDRRLSSLNEKLHAHLSLFDSIEKEAFSFKQVMDNIQLVVSQKEDVVAGLRSKMDKVATFEKVFAEKVHDLQNKQRRDEDEIRKKAEIISMLEKQLQSEKFTNNSQIQIEELQKILSAKDAAIQNLIFEREALHHEVENLTKILQKVMETVTSMGEEDKRIFNCALKCQEDCNMIATNEENWIEAAVQHSGEPTLNKAFTDGAADDQASLLCQEQNSVGTPLLETNHLGSCLSETQSPCSELQSAVNGRSVSVNNGQVNSNANVYHLDSECSTTQVEASEIPGVS
ncbi:uncharacterized protein LOC126685910 isoform X2 [Mercurialis annua]|uniref:uncharacterized protein LOC126685910 isoform X2 n=1 Tax=Mercurialis annua TaxID=3986 RepID=UPI00216077BD|nr:uncharacterized protein LOC126685910 isoform X2 [Mercurialis annua]